MKTHAVNHLRVILLILIQTVAGLCISQTATPKFKHLTSGDGLSQISVFAILKDYKGFMWFGTNEGLNKYDGYKFTVYKHNTENERSIGNNSIYGLMEDTAHNLWVVTPGGVEKFDRLNESFIHYGIDDHTVIFRNIFLDSKKRIWLSTSDGFCLFDPITAKFRFYKNKPYQINSLSNNYVYNITDDNEGQLWIATRKGLNRFDPETETFERYHNDPLNSKSIGAGYIKKVYKDRKGNIWAGTQGSGIALFNRSDNSFINFKHDPLDVNSISHNDILSFAEDSEGKLWIGTENGGISVFDYSKKALPVMPTMKMTSTAFRVIRYIVFIKMDWAICGQVPGQAVSTFSPTMEPNSGIIKKFPAITTA